MKDLNCPNCSGRSYAPVDPGDYYECQLCERPDERFVARYRAKWPDVYAEWMKGKAA